MFSWYKDLTKPEKRTYWACFSGWGLDAMDTQMYALAIPTLIALWGMTRGEAGLCAIEIKTKAKPARRRAHGERDALIFQVLTVRSQQMLNLHYVSIAIR